MSLAENLLNSLDETAYQNSRIEGIEPEEEHIIVGQDRVITVPNNLKTIAVKGDKDIETVTFDCVRYWDGHDLSTFAIYINYILPSGDEGTYIPKNITKLDDIFTFDWKIGNEITYAQGKLTFWIVAKLTDDSGDLIKQWSSLQNSDCNIAQGGDKIYVPEKQTDQDVISQAISISRESAETAEQQANLAIEAANKAALDASRAAEEEVTRIIGELGVVQELGDSPNSVVSQLKVTKEFNQTNAKINRNSKRITNLEQGLPAELFETDSTVAYQKDVPENVLPYASINRIGGMTYRDDTTNTLHDAKVTAIKSVGANLIDLNKITKISLEKITIIDNEVHIAAGSTIYGFQWNFNPNLEIGKTYYFGANVSRPEKHGYSIKYKDGEIISNILNKAFTITKKVDRVLFYIGYGVAYDDKTVISDLQIIKGTTAQPYTPYAEHTLPIPETVQAIHGYGWGVNESANNYLDFEKQQFVQSVEKIDLGSLTWSNAGGYGSPVFRTPIENIKPFDGEVFATLLCEKYDTLPYNALYYGGNSGIAVDYDGNLAVLDSAYSDVTSFKEAMNGVFAYIELAEPIITDISDLLSSDNFIEVEGGGVIAFENEYGVAVPSEVEYQVEV